MDHAVVDLARAAPPVSRLVRAARVVYPCPDVMYYARGSSSEKISDSDLRDGLGQALRALGTRRRVLAVPPDFTRFHSLAGRITELAWEHYGDSLTDVLPATGTHFAVSDEERRRMFGGVPAALFRVHRWKDNLEVLGRVPADFIREVSGGSPLLRLARPG